MISPVKLLVIGLDGINFDLLRRLLPKEVMPSIWAIIQQGVSGDLESVFPTHSAAAWSSFMTGQVPANHGVFDFKVRLPDGRYRHAKPDPKVTLWQLLGHARHRLGVFNFPITYPPDAINGWMISGMLSPNLQRFTNPSALATELTSVFPDYILDVEWTLYEGREESLLKDLTLMVRQRGAVARYLLEHHPVDVFAMAFIATDRAQHVIWRHLDPSHPMHDPGMAARLAPLIRDFYFELDQAVASLLAYTTTHTSVLLLSDHGFQAAAWQFHVDRWLEKQGWQKQHPMSGQLKKWFKKLEPAHMRHIRQRLWPDASRHFRTFSPGGTLNWSQTLAFCPWNFHQGIRINLQGRDSRGVVAPGAEYARLRTDIARALEALRSPTDGSPVISKIYFIEDLCQGVYQEAMPDLIFDLHPNFAPGIHRQNLFEPTGWLSGDHNRFGLYALCGPGLFAEQDLPACLVDMAPTILYLLGIQPPESMDGRPLRILPERQLVPSDLNKQTADNNVEPQAELTLDEEQKLLQQLHDLGYL